MLGGCFSLLVTMLLFKIGIENAFRMINRIEPDIISIEEKLDYGELGEQHMHDMSKFLLELTEDSPDNTFDLNEH